MCACACAPFDVQMKAGTGKLLPFNQPGAALMRCVAPPLRAHASIWRLQGGTIHDRWVVLLVGMALYVSADVLMSFSADAMCGAGFLLWRTTPELQPPWHVFFAQRHACDHPSCRCRLLRVERRNGFGALADAGPLGAVMSLLAERGVPRALPGSRPGAQQQQCGGARLTARCCVPPAVTFRRLPPGWLEKQEHQKDEGEAEGTASSAAGPLLWAFLASAALAVAGTFVGRAAPACWS